MPTPTFANVTALVADENAHMRRLVRDMLARVGIRRILEAPDGAEAITLLSEGAPDLVLLDWDLPVLSGEDLVRLIRTAKTSPAPKIPVILMTARPWRSAVARAAELGASEVIAKPFAPRTLWARLDEVISRPRAFVAEGELLRPLRRSPVALAA